MAHYVISDIHGEADRFHRMLEQIAFSGQDTLYILGDVIDRGEEGIPLLREILACPQMVMLLGNHEYMCLQYHSLEATEVEVRRWNRNGNAPTLAGLDRLTSAQRAEVFAFLRQLPVHLDLCVEGCRFHLVHGFPGETVRDQVWERPAPDSPNPFPDGRQVIVGHTPVLSLGHTKEERERLADALQARGEHLRIFHGPGFVDLDCGCGHDLPVKALACLRLVDMAEFYV